MAPPASPWPNSNVATGTAGRDLLRAGQIEQEVARLLDEVRSRHGEAPSDETERQIEFLESRHARALERLIDLQRTFLPSPMSYPARVGSRGDTSRARDGG